MSIKAGANTSAIASLLKAKLTRLNYSLIESSSKLEKELEHDEAFVSYMEGTLEVIKLLKQKLARKNIQAKQIKEVPFRKPSNQIDFYGESGTDLEKVICVSNKCSEEEDRDDRYLEEASGHTSIIRNSPPNTERSSKKKSVIQLLAEKVRCQSKVTEFISPKKAVGVSKVKDSLRNLVKSPAKMLSDRDINMLPKLGSLRQKDEGVIDNIQINQVGTKININLNTKNIFEPGAYTFNSVANNPKQKQVKAVNSKQKVRDGRNQLRPRLMNIFCSHRGSDCGEQGQDSFALCLLPVT